MLFRAFCLVLLVFVAPVQAYADALTRAMLAGLSGSERLRQFTLGQATLQHRDDPRLRAAMRTSLQETGFYFAGSGPAVLSRQFRWSPVLSYDANINGGFLNDQFDIFGLAFEVDAARRALPGVVAGLRGAGDLRVGYGEGRYLDLRGSLEAVWSPEHGIGRGQAGFEACARNHLRGWTFADFCVTGARSWRSLSSSTTATASLRFAHLVATGTSEHEFSAGVTRYFQDPGPQNALSFGWTAVWNRATTGVDLTLAAPVAGETAMRHRLSANATWLWGTRPVSVGIWQQVADGGLFLGAARADRVQGLSLTVRPRADMAEEFVHQVTDSTINLFDENRMGINLRFDLR